MVQTVQSPQQEGQAPERIEQLPVMKGLRKYAANHVLLVGKPGSGKSTAELAQEWITDWSAKVKSVPTLAEQQRFSNYWVANIDTAMLSRS